MNRKDKTKKKWAQFLTLAIRNNKRFFTVKNTKQTSSIFSQLQRSYLIDSYSSFLSSKNKKGNQFYVLVKWDINADAAICQISSISKRIRAKKQSNDKSVYAVKLQDIAALRFLKTKNKKTLYSYVEKIAEIY